MRRIDDLLGERLRAREAWTFKLTGSGCAGLGPEWLVSPHHRSSSDGVVYLQDRDANVYAIALTTGKLKWEYRINRPGEERARTRTASRWRTAAVYGDTSTTAFALNATTGQTRSGWTPTLLDAGQGTFEIQPQVADGRVYLASAYGSGPGGGVLLALNAAELATCCGEFNTVFDQTQASSRLASAPAAPGSRRWSAATDR